MNLYEMLVDGGFVQIICDTHFRTISEIREELINEGHPKRLVLRFYKKI